MATSSTQTDEVLAVARRELEAQLDIVREGMERLAAEESALTHALTSLHGDGARASAGRGSRTRPAGSQRASATRKTSGRRRRQRGASKTTAERVQELRALLSDGPKSRSELAATLNVSPPRVQQLLAELGGGVSSKPDPANPRGKLWSLTSSGTGAAAAKGGGARKRGSSRASARKRAAAK